jgi:hypothetical protein
MASCVAPVLTPTILGGLTLGITLRATRHAALGFGCAEIVAILQTMQRAHFYKSMTAYADHRIWQDVYHVPSQAGVLYAIPLQELT